MVSPKLGSVCNYRLIRSVCEDCFCGNKLSDWCLLIGLKPVINVVSCVQRRSMLYCFLRGKRIAERKESASSVRWGPTKALCRNRLWKKEKADKEKGSSERRDGLSCECPTMQNVFLNDTTCGLGMLFMVWRVSYHFEQPQEAERQ